MGNIEKRTGKYRVRYADLNGSRRSKTFNRKVDAERFLREMEVAIDRNQWIDPRSAEMLLKDWAKEFMLLSRRLALSTQETYERDLSRYLLPRFGSYRLGRLPADEIENWLNDEIALGIAPSSVHRHYRILRRNGVWETLKSDGTRYRALAAEKWSQKWVSGLHFWLCLLFLPLGDVDLATRVQRGQPPQLVWLLRQVPRWRGRRRFLASLSSVHLCPTVVNTTHPIALLDHCQLVSKR